MKKHHTLAGIAFLIILFLLGSCKKDTIASGKKTTVNSIVYGNWELMRRVGGNIKDSVFAPGNGNTILITDTEIRYYLNGQLTNTVPYTIQPAGVNEYLLTFTNDPMFNSLLTISGDEADFKSSNPDAATLIYHRL